MHLANIGGDLITFALVLNMTVKSTLSKLSKAACVALVTSTSSKTSSTTTVSGTLVMSSSPLWFGWTGTRSLCGPHALDLHLVDGTPSETRPPGWRLLVASVIKLEMRAASVVFLAMRTAVMST